MSFIVGRCATPFAVYLVCSALFFSSPTPGVRTVCATLLAFSVVLNLAALDAIKSDPGVLVWLRGSRLWVNLVNNAIIVYLLFEKWHTIWLLLPLTAFATAAYDTRARTLAMSAVVSAVLVFVRLLSHGTNAAALGRDLAHIAFIFSVSLMINRVAAAARNDYTAW